ncbi:MAG: branched-chain amino acid ABC transporter substrate-binding protein [Ktedonobacteraceae bacterium]|nr:branched-chain amino acid ABC transporter substrate-binding protein [Ktedonobacteraceae bacterium]
MRRRWSRIFAMSLALPMLLALLAACGAGTGTGGTGGTGGAAQGPITLKIGTDLPVSNKDESNGKPAQNGVQVAINDANAQNLVPNVKFVPNFKDDVGPSGAHDPATGQKNVNELIGDAQVVGIVGPFNSNVAQAEMPVANQAPIAMISPANTNDCLTTSTDDCSGANNKLPTYRPTGKVTYFRLATLDKYQGGSLADFGYTKKGWKKVYIVDDGETYGVGLANNFEKRWKSLGGTVLGHKSQPSTTTSYVGLLTEIGASKPDVIFFGGTDSSGGTPFRQQAGQVPALKGIPLMGGDGLKSSSFARTVGPAARNQVYASVATVDATGGAQAASDQAKKFLDAYDKLYGLNNISAYSASGYDCAMILMTAVKNAIAAGAKPPANPNDTDTAKTFRQAVIDAIQKIDYNGVTGHHTFDQNGDTTSKTITIYTVATDVNVRDGWEVVDTIKVS